MSYLFDLLYNTLTLNFRQEQHSYIEVRGSEFRLLIVAVIVPSPALCMFSQIKYNNIQTQTAV